MSDHDAQANTSSAPLGWWAISGDQLLALLRRVHEGEDPDLLYAEEYANGEHSEEGSSELYKWAYTVWMAFLADEETHELKQVLRNFSGWMFEQQEAS